MKLTLWSVQVLTMKLYAITNIKWVLSIVINLSGVRHSPISSNTRLNLTFPWPLLTIVLDITRLLFRAPHLQVRLRSGWVCSSFICVKLGWIQPCVIWVMPTPDPTTRSASFISWWNVMPLGSVGHS